MLPEFSNSPRTPPGLIMPACILLVAVSWFFPWRAAVPYPLESSLYRE